jgi:hypothetical protein
LISADDDVATPRIGQQPTESFPSQKIIAGTTIVHILDLGMATQAHSLNEFGASTRLNIQTEHLLAFVIL